MSSLANARATSCRRSFSNKQHRVAFCLVSLTVYACVCAVACGVCTHHFWTSCSYRVPPCAQFPPLWCVRLFPAAACSTSHFFSLSSLVTSSTFSSLTHLRFHTRNGNLEADITNTTSPFPSHLFSSLPPTSYTHHSVLALPRSASSFLFRDSPPAPFGGSHGVSKLPRGYDMSLENKTSLRHTRRNVAKS